MPRKNNHLGLKIKADVLNQLKKDKACQRALEDFWGRHSTTVADWIRMNDPQLCHMGSLRIISAYLKIDIIDLVEGELINELVP